MDVNACLDKVGGYRRYSMAAFFIMGTSVCFGVASQIMVFVFIGRTPTHHCKLPVGALVNESIPLNEGTGDLESCSMYVNSTNVTTACDHGWTYHNPDKDYTMINEWDLVCERGMLPELSMTVFGIGGLVGDLVGNVLADKLGRKWVHITCSIIIVISGSATAFAKNFNVYIVFIVFTSMASTACVSTGITHLLELFDKKRRSNIGIGMEFLWISGCFYVGLMGYLIRNWRHLQLVLSLTSAMGLLNLFFPESPMWLLANHKIQSANKSLKQMARWNGVKVDGPLLSEEEDILMSKNRGSKDRDNMAKTAKRKKSDKSPPEETGQETILDLFRWTLICKYTFMSSMLLFTHGIVYYFVVLSTPSLAGNFYSNFFLGCLVEVPAYVIAMSIIKFGRRLPTIVPLMSASMSLLAVGFIPRSGTAAYVVTAIALWGRFSITVSYAVLYLYTRELFPTNLRTTSFGLYNIMGRVGLLVAPLAAYAAKSVPWVPNFVLAIVALIVALMTFLLPETKDWPLPMSIADVYRYSRGSYPAPKRQATTRSV